MTFGEVEWTNKELIVGSLDVKALYPSLKVEKTCEIVGWMVERSQITFEVDKKSLGRYVRLTVSQEDIKKAGVDQFCPHTCPAGNYNWDFSRRREPPRAT